MDRMRELKTERLILRCWRESDLEPLAMLNADPEVMEYFPSVLTCAESDARVEGIRRHFEQHGYGLWAVEVPGVSPFIGFTGLNIPQIQAHFTPCVEIGWRLARHAWGHGYATEAARACVDFAFLNLGLDRIVSYTTVKNPVRDGSWSVWG